jgi:catechol 2,3-dioxygenase-like lactoylglutathione lyase family enzyme
MLMLTYASVGSNDLEKAKAFYDSLLSSVGVNKLFDHPSGGRVYGAGGPMFAVLGPYNGEKATAGNGSMSGFGLQNREQVAAFHAKALELGGTCEGPPGLRGPEAVGAYFAYVRDLDGNKLCAYKFG